MKWFLNVSKSLLLLACTQRELLILAGNVWLLYSEKPFHFWQIVIKSPASPLFSRWAVILINTKKQGMSGEWLRVDFQHYCGAGSSRSAGLGIWLIHGQNAAFPFADSRCQTNATLVLCHVVSLVSWGFLLCARCRRVVSVLAEIVRVLCVCKCKRNLWWQLQDIPRSSWLQRELRSVCVWEFFTSLMFIKYPNWFLWNSVMTKSNIKRSSHYFSFFYVLLLFTNFFFIFPVPWLFSLS